MGNNSIAGGALILHMITYGVHSLPKLRAPCKAVMRKACRVSDAWREKMCDVQVSTPGSNKIARWSLFGYLGIAVVHFKRLGSRGFHDLFNHFLCFFSKHNEYCKTEL